MEAKAGECLWDLTGRRVLLGQLLKAAGRGFFCSDLPAASCVVALGLVSLLLVQ